MPRGKDDTGAELYGAGLLGESLAPEQGSVLGEKFMVPPFSVLNAREGYWQDRKRAWLAFGIQSELGRGEDLVFGDAIAWQGQQAQQDDQSANVAVPVAPAMVTPAPALFPTIQITAAQRPAPTTVARGMPLVKMSEASGRPMLPPAPIITPTALIVPAVTLTSAPPPPEPWANPFLEFHADTLKAAGQARLAFNEDTWDWEDKSPVGVDVECARNFFLVCLQRFSTGARMAFEMSHRSTLNVQALHRALTGSRLITFNGHAYDMPIIFYAIGGADHARIFDASWKIINGHMRAWDTERELGVRIPRLDHVDLLEPNPSVRQSLKTLGARLHTRFLVDLPFEPNATLSAEQMNVATLYCFNDLDMLQALFDALKEPYELRRALSNEYKTDLRSKSDAQIGEAIVKMRVEAATGRRIGKVDPQPFTFKYNPPAWITFEDERMNNLLQLLRTSEFSVDYGGNITQPEWLKDCKVQIGEAEYNMGIGGLHSTEAHRSVKADENNALIDVDVSSQYPSIIIKLGMSPPLLGADFFTIYKKIMEERLAAKAAGDKVKADGLKISLNGVYGKLGSSYSPLYAPNIMISVTLTGQLSLLMLIERVTAAGIRVESGNTDGVVMLCPRGLLQTELPAIIKKWEDDTGFICEQTPYKAIYSRDVNTYIAIKENGKAKRKGPVADPWGDKDYRAQLSKNPQMTVCSDAVLKMITTGANIEDTIRACGDPRMFITCIKVTGGALWRGHPLGRVVRYYWAINGDPIVYANAKRKVSNTDGAKPMMELTGDLPSDLDYQRYINEAKDLAEELAVVNEHGLLT